MHNAVWAILASYPGLPVFFNVEEHGKARVQG